LVICNEIVSWIEHLMGPIEISDETLALDMIDELGPDGDFLGTDHTMEHFRERWYPNVFERGNYEQWQAAGSMNLGERAAERVSRILEEHKREPLPKDVAEQVSAIVRRSEERSG
jgi:trimethylamine--corrinoid protein Co-methyltransferase